MKSKFIEMIVEAIFKFDEPNGTSREEIWKFIQTRYPETVISSNHKNVFLA